MSFSVTRTATSTFTIVHARYLASKVAADMHLCAQYYGHPSEQRIRDYAEELAHYLNEGYIHEYEFGYKKDGRRLVTWRYRVDENGILTTDDRPGRVVAYVDVSGASFFDFLTHNARWFRLPLEQRERFERAPCQSSAPRDSRRPMAPATGSPTATTSRAVTA